jgi:hypothetical protein
MSASAEQNWLLAVILVGSLALMFGLWRGSSSEREGWYKLLQRADLPDVCERRLKNAADETRLEE